MPDRRSFRSTAAMITAGQSSTSLAEPFAEMLPGMSAAVSVLGNPFGVQTLAASDPIAERCSESQIDVGEGPIWTARSSRRSVLLPDVSGAASSWPAFAMVLAEVDVRSVFAFPMTVGSLDVGVVSMYCVRSRAIPPTDLQDTLFLVDVVARRIVRHALDDSGGRGASIRHDLFSRREVHQATGMVIAQLAVSAEDALLSIRAHAYATGSTVREVARAIVARELDLSSAGDGD